MLRSIGRLLKQFGYEGLLFESAEAFEDHRDFAHVACVLLDINLGDVSGFDVRHRLRAANLSVPVIYMTGNDGPGVRDAALRSGCLAYLTKPFSAKSLIELLQRTSSGGS
jgi:FixJ family two-component response regulator